jgi:hypothetical protein
MKPFQKTICFGISTICSAFVFAYIIQTPLPNVVVIAYLGVTGICYVFSLFVILNMDTAQ